MGELLYCRPFSRRIEIHGSLVIFEFPNITKREFLQKDSLAAPEAALSQKLYY